MELSKHLLMLALVGLVLGSVCVCSYVGRGVWLVCLCVSVYMAWEHVAVYVCKIVCGVIV